MSFRTSARTMVLTACLGQLLASCAQDTSDHLDFALPTATFTVSDGSSHWRTAPANMVPDMVCAGPQALGFDCCSPPASLPPVDCGQYPVSCDPIEHLCAFVFDVEPHQDVDLFRDVAAIAAVDGRVFMKVTLVELETLVQWHTTVTGSEQVPIRNAALYIGPKGLLSASSPEATLLGQVSLVAGKNVVALGPDAQARFSSYAREYRNPFSLLLSAHAVVFNTTPTWGQLEVTVRAKAVATY